MKRARALLSLLKSSWNEFSKDDAMVLGAAMAFWAVLSLVPLLSLLLGLFGRFLSVWPEALDARTELLRIVQRHFGPQFAYTVAGLLDGMVQGFGPATGIGLIFLLFGAAGVFRQLRYSFQKIWGWRPPEATGLQKTLIFNLLQQVAAMLLALGAMGVFLASFLITAAYQAMRQYLEPRFGLAGTFEPVVELLLVLLMTVLVFVLMYRVLPPVRVPWRYVWPSALLAGILWEIGKRILTLYLLLFPTMGLYGAAGFLFALMLWVYVSCQILFFGAEFCKVWARTAQIEAERRPAGQEVINSTEAGAESR